MRRTLPLAIVAVVAALGCKRSEPSPAAPLPSAQPAPDLGNAKKLALADPSGTADVDGVIRQLQATLKKSPNEPDHFILLGRAWVRKARETADPGYYLQAEACADFVLDMDPDSALGRGLRAHVWVNEHRFAEAKDLAEQALARSPQDLVALGVLADAQLELGRYDDAESTIQRMVDVKPSLPAYIRAYYVRWLRGDRAQAKKIVRLAIDAGRDGKDREPGAWALTQAAMIFLQEGDYEGADAGFDTALARFASYPPALAGKGRVALARGDGKAAVAHLTRAFADSPLVETAWLLGDAHELAGDAEGAKRAYAEVERRGRATDHRTLALFYAVKNQRADEAVKLLEGERKVRGDIYTDDAYAWALFRAGKLAEAKAASDRALRLSTKDASLLYHAGAIRLASGQREGLALVEEALALHPKFDVTGAREAAALVREHKK